jgi:hypothetical protein
MKIKRFKNLWAMGLLLFGAILIAFYVAKILFPQFIIGIAETPQIVKIGNTIQSNKILLHLFNLITGYINGYIFTCACCRKYKLNLKDNLILLTSLVLLSIVLEFYPEHYNTINYISIILVPFLICFVNKELNQQTFTSTTICFCLDLAFQVFSILVRNLVLLTTQGNVVTMLVLILDMTIWRVILYLFFNYKN